MNTINSPKYNNSHNGNTNCQDSNNHLSWYTNLIQWIQVHGGSVCESLDIFSSNSNTHNSTMATNTSSLKNIHHRGIYAKEDIPQGTLLVRVPHSLVISGESLPERYTVSSITQENDHPETREREQYASSWLRCMASTILLYHAYIDSHRNQKSSVDFSPYFQSLPLSFDSLIHESFSWSDHDVHTFLSGTSLGYLVAEDRKSNILQRRFETTVKPYLDALLSPSSLSSLRSFVRANNTALDRATTVHVDNNITNHDTQPHAHPEYPDTTFDTFLYVCACICTRGFHTQTQILQDPVFTSTQSSHPESSSSSSSCVQEEAVSTPYAGPYLIPFIDLINHSSLSTSKCTTLQQDTSSFYMMAERRIHKGEEIFHSYGETLNSAQFLQTFGFIDPHVIRQVLQEGGGNDQKDWYDTTRIPTIPTPAVLSKSHVWEACQFIRSSSVPDQLRDCLKTLQYKIRCHPSKNEEEEEEEVKDEYWDLPNAELFQVRNDGWSNLLPDNFLITQECLLSQGLITFCCIQYLPEGAYQEWIGSDTLHAVPLLSKDVLDDYFLGQLVYRTIEYAIDSKLREYSNLQWDECKKAIVALASSKHPFPIDLERNSNGMNTSANSIRQDRQLLGQLWKMSEEEHVCSNTETEFVETTIPSVSITDLHSWRRAIYGLIIRIEEKINLYNLQKECSVLSVMLHEDVFLGSSQKSLSSTWEDRTEVPVRFDTISEPYESRKKPKIQCEKLLS